MAPATILADTTAYTWGGAGIAVLLGVVTAVASILAAKRAGEAAVQSAQAARLAAEYSVKLTDATNRTLPQEERFATWQMHKREVYARLIEAIRDAHAATQVEKPEKVKKMLNAFDAAGLVA